MRDIKIDPLRRNSVCLPKKIYGRFGKDNSLVNELVALAPPRFSGSRVFGQTRNEFMDFEKLKPVVEIIAKLHDGVLPGEKTLIKMGYPHLIVPIRENGNFSGVREAIGAKAPVSFKNKTPLIDINLVISELQEIQRQNNGVFPTWGYLADIKRFDLRHAITNYHGGYYEVQKTMGRQVNVLVNDESLLLDGNYEKKKLEVLSANGNVIPVRKTLLEQGFGDFVSATYKKEKTLTKLKKENGQEIGKRVYEDSLQHWRNLKPVLISVLETHKFAILPNNQWEGWQKEYCAEYTAINRHHGGILEVTERLGPMPVPGTDLVSYRSWEDLLSKLMQIIRENNNQLPLLDVFVSRPKYELILASMYQYHGGIYKVRYRLECVGEIDPIYRKIQRTGERYKDQRLRLVQGNQPSTFK